MSLSTDQQNATDKFMKFMLGKQTKEMALIGHSGCGKTFLTKHLIKSVRKAKKLLNLLTGDDNTVNIHCTATTNKAASVLSQSTGEEAGTIHSLLGLKVFNNYNNGTTSLQKTGSFSPIKNSLIIIDEASMENNHLLKIIRESTPDCKVLHVLDPYQLLPIFETVCPVEQNVEHRAILKTAQRFGSNITIPELGEGYRKCIDIIKAIPPELKRLADEEATLVRNGAVISANNLQQYNDIIKDAFPKVQPHGKEIQLVTGAEFQQLVKTQFGNKTIDPNEAKITAWTNAKVNSYNDYVRALHTSDPKPFIGESLITNNPISTGSIGNKKGVVMPTDSIAKITSIDVHSNNDYYDIDGWNATLNHNINVFIPCDQRQVKQVLGRLAKQARKNKDWTEFFNVKEAVCDLRPVYSSTVHKSQGSTYQKSFVDMDDIGNNNNPEEVARLLYVATTRPSDEVIIYGKLPKKYGG